MRFAKYHGLGNDFVVVDLRGVTPVEGEPWPEEPDVVRALCDRQFGVGADGVLPILSPVTDGAHARMRVLNADGGEAEMCGNGIRCIAKYLYERDPKLHRDSLLIDTGAGPLECQLDVVGHVVAGVTVDMGRPRLNRGEIPMTGPADQRCLNVPLEIDGRRFAITAVSMGNPHAIAFVDEAGADLRDLAVTFGPFVESHDWFPQRTNAEFVRYHSTTELELVVWERGSGLTSACGTGACATAVAACLDGKSEPGTMIQVTLPGGPLHITVDKDYSTVYMRGPATHVFDAEADLSEIMAAARS